MVVDNLTHYQTKMQKKNHRDVVAPYEHTHTLHHTMSKKIGGTQCKKLHTKDPLNTLKYASSSMKTQPNNYRTRNIPITQWSQECGYRQRTIK